MKEKFIKIRPENRTELYKMLAEEFGATFSNVQKNWFNKGFIQVPRNITNEVDSFLDNFIKMQSENDRYKNESRIKYFGK